MRCAAVVIPTLNEASNIGGLLAQVARLPTNLVVDILVADGGSTDATRDIVHAAARDDARIRLIDNPGRIQACGVNLAAAAANLQADTLVRIDAHSGYDDDFVPCVVAAFDATGAEMVAVRLVTRGTTCVQHGIAAAANSRIGSGGSAHRSGGASGFTDHGHHAGIDRAMFVRVGGYDESFAANEDAELDLRIRRAGGRIWFAADIAVDYAPRASLRRLFVQYLRYGRGRAMTFQKHRERLRLRQMIPPVAVTAMIAAMIAAPVWPQLLAVPALYLLAIGAAALLTALRTRERCALIAAPAMAVMHFAWSFGFIGRLVRRPAHNKAFVTERCAVGGVTTANLFPKGEVRS